MIITRSQFNEIGKFYTDDFPIDDSDQDLMYRIFILLPKSIQATAIAWGFTDTVFGDEVFEFLCENQLGMTCKEYYKSEIAKNYFKNNITINIDFEKMKSE